MAIGQKGKKMTDKAPEQVFGQPNKMTLAHVIQERDSTFKTMLEHRQALTAERDKLRDIARQAVCVIDSVQKEENALAMCEHEVFDFDVDAARAELGETENDTD